MKSVVEISYNTMQKSIIKQPSNDKSIIYLKYIYKINV